MFCRGGQTPPLRITPSILTGLNCRDSFNKGFAFAGDGCGYLTSPRHCELRSSEAIRDKYRSLAYVCVT